MIAVDTLLKNLRNYLASSQSFSDISFICAFTGQSRPSPLVRPIVALSVKTLQEADVNPVYSKVDEAAGELPQLLYNHETNIRLKLDIHVPQEQNGVGCYEIYNRLSQFLTDYNFTIPMVGNGCEELRYERDMGAFALYAFVDLQDHSIVE